MAIRTVYRGTCRKYRVPPRSHIIPFLAKLLQDSEYSPIIQWISAVDFVVKNPNGLTKLWAASRNRDKMTWDSMSRSIRTYTMQCKVIMHLDEPYHYRFLVPLNEIINTVPKSPVRINKNSSNTEMTIYESSLSVDSNESSGNLANNKPKMPKLTPKPHWLD